MMLLSPDESAVTPLVYVRSTDSAVWESSCASGTAAVGAWASFRSGEDARRSVVRATRQGRALADALSGSIAAQYEDLAQHLGAEPLQQLYRLLDGLLALPAHAVELQKSVEE